MLCDVSGSMEPYSRAILLFVHGLLESGRGVEAFAFGTRLTRLTEELAGPDPERALEVASKRVVDWSGGTRIGASLKAFNDLWGRRALSRGAVVVSSRTGGSARTPRRSGVRWHGSPAARTRLCG